MAARERAARASSKARAAADSPYLRRLIEDRELRDRLWSAFEASRSAYTRFQKDKGRSRSLMDDRKLQRDLKEAAKALREASVSFKAGTRKQRRSGGGLGRKLFIALVAAGLALALSESLRGKVLDLLFGAEEEFEYSSVTEPNSTPEKVAA